VSSLISAVEAGNGVALVPDSMGCIAGPRLKLMPLAPQPEPLVIGLIYPKTGLSINGGTFAQCAKQVSQSP